MRNRGDAMDKKKSYHHGDLRRALIEAALQVIREDGIRGLTLRETARRAGVSHAAPAYHFKDLSGLLAAVAQKGFEDLYAAMTSAAEAEDADDPLAPRIRPASRPCFTPCSQTVRPTHPWRLPAAVRSTFSWPMWPAARNPGS